jgi:hypothetical protein
VGNSTEFPLEQLVALEQQKGTVTTLWQRGKPKKVVVTDVPAGKDTGPWNHAHVLTPKGMELMDEAFNNVKVQEFKVHMTEHKNEHIANVSKNSTRQRE